MLIPILTLTIFTGYVLAKQPVVNLGYATYTGNYLAEVKQNEFLGIRFGAPPVGERRFRAPQDPGFLGHQNATTFPPVCYGIESKPDAANTSEDCLFLSIYAPSNLKQNEKVPVFVWIQGGGFTADANANWNGSSLVTAAGNKMMFLEFQYRVGPHGFLASQEIKDNGDLNVGLLDQRAVLLWVQKYISKFGGDPGHVVIVGASAGAASVGTHIISYGGKGHPVGESTKPLFIGAAGISPGFSFPSLRLSMGESTYAALLKSTNCTSSGLACLRGLDSKVLQRAIYDSGPGGGVPGASGDNVTMSSMPYGPVVDGTFLQDDYWKYFHSGQMQKVPVIFGDDTNEASQFAPNLTSAAEVAGILRGQFNLTDTQVTQVLDLYPVESFPPAAQHARYYSVIEAIMTEATFVCSGIKLSEAFNRAGVPSWNYRYDVVSEEDAASGLGSPHTSELRNLFNGVPRYMDYPPWDVNSPLMVKTLQAYYTNFVRFLNPNGPTSRGEKGATVPVSWPTFNASTPRLLWRINGTSVEIIPRDQKTRCAFWDGLAGR